MLVDVDELPQCSFVVESDFLSSVVDSLAPVASGVTAHRAVVAARGSLRITEHVYREENARSSRGGRLLTTWWLSEAPIDAIVAGLPEDKRDAARAALEEPSPR
jgi:hypothetical protein